MFKVCKRIICWLVGHNWDDDLVPHKCLSCGFEPCKWHEGEKSEEAFGVVSCSNCGTAIDMIFCEACRKWFVDWESGGSGDGIIGAPVVGSSGDLLCAECARAEQEAEQEEENDDPGAYDDF